VTHAGISARPGRTRKEAPHILIGALLLVSVGLAISSGTAVGSDVADLTVTEGEPAERDYGPILGSSPDTAANPPGRTPAQCASGLHCDVIDLTINIPSRYTRFDLYSVAVTLSWGNPSANNMNVYLYDTNKTTNLRSAATANHPEKLEVLEPPAGRYYVTVLNESGPNAGYKVKAEFFNKGRIEEPDEPREESGSAISGGSASDEFGFEDLNPDLPPVPATGTEGGKPRAVETPGPDGPTTKARLATLGLARGFRDSTTMTSVILGGAATAIVLVFGAILFVRHRRSVYEEELAKI
jgi:hypothetical protein